MRNTKSLKLLLCTTLLYMCFAQSHAERINQLAIIKLTLPLPANDKTPKNYYIEELLRKALEKENLKLELHYTKNRMNQLRMTKSLINKEFIDLTWLPYTTERDQKILAIKIPLYKGLHGLRLLIVNKNNLEKFEDVNTIAQLNRYIGVQHHSWSDYEVLVDNELRIKGELTYTGMFKAVSSGLSDYFPRSALAIRNELKSNGNSQLVIEPTLALNYSSYVNFFVSKKTPELAQLIRSGMKKLIADGSFDRIFYKYNSKNIHNLNLEQRKIIELKNNMSSFQQIY